MEGRITQRWTCGDVALVLCKCSWAEEYRVLMCTLMAGRPDLAHPPSAEEEGITLVTLTPA